MASASKSQSLWSDAWRRLRKNKFAMVGLIIVVLVSLSAIFAPLLTPYQSDYGQPWLRAQAPGFSHPVVLAETRFVVGTQAAVPEGVPEQAVDVMTTDGVVAYTFLEFRKSGYRIKVRKGKVSKIQRIEGATSIKRLVIEGAGRYARPANGPADAQFSDVIFERRKPLPADFDPWVSTGNILMLDVIEPATDAPETATVTIKDGIVSEILRNGKPVEAITRNGEQIREINIDGRYIHQTKKDGVERRLKHPLGTDLAGRDVLARVIYGGRISLMVGAIATLVSVLIGVIYGAFAGYLAHSPMTRWHSLLLIAASAIAILGGYLIYQLTSSTGYTTLALALALFGLPLLLGGLGKLMPAPLNHPVTTKGEFMMRVVDVLNALPFMFLVILLMVSFGHDIFTLFLALGAVQWLTIARIVRGQVLSLKEKEFVEAAEMSGSGHARIVFSHLIPNTLGVVIVYATLTIPAVILQESFLSFIGLTVEFQGRALDSWGSLINIGRQALTEDGGNWWILIFPSLAMAITLFSLNFFGDGLRDALDPKLKGRS